MLERYEALLAKHRQASLTDAEVIELYDLQRGQDHTRIRAYSRLIAAMFVFVPYLEMRPQLIDPFIQAVYSSSQNIFAGVKGRAELVEFLQSKAQVDHNLDAALRNQNAAFEASLDKLFD